MSVMPTGCTRVRPRGSGRRARRVRAWSETGRRSVSRHCQRAAHDGRFALWRCPPLAPQVERHAARGAARVHARARDDARVRGARRHALASRRRRADAARLRRRRGMGARRGRERGARVDARRRARAADALDRDDAVRAAALAGDAHDERGIGAPLPRRDGRLGAHLLSPGLSRRFDRDVGRGALSRDASVARRHDHQSRRRDVPAELDVRHRRRRAERGGTQRRSRTR